MYTAPDINLPGRPLTCDYLGRESRMSRTTAPFRVQTSTRKLVNFIRRRLVNTPPLKPENVFGHRHVNSGARYKNNLLPLKRVNSQTRYTRNLPSPELVNSSPCETSEQVVTESRQRVYSQTREPANNLQTEHINPFPRSFPNTRRRQSCQ